MLEFLAAIGLETKLTGLAPQECHVLPEEQPDPLRSGELVRELLARSVPPIVHPLNGGGYGVVSGAALLVAAKAVAIDRVSCAVITTIPLSAGVCEFLRSAGEMYAGRPLHPVLWAQVIWLVFFWTNAQALYEQRIQDDPDSPVTSPLTFTGAAPDIDGLCAGIETYMRTYFYTPADYLAPSSRRVVVPWRACLAPFPQAPSETKRKVLIRLLSGIPPGLRAGFRELECSESMLRMLAALPHETMRRVLAVLQESSPKRRREILQQIKQAGILTGGSPDPKAHAVADAYPAGDAAPGELPATMFHPVLRGLNQINRLLLQLPPGTRLTARQQKALLQVSLQLWEHLDPLLESGGEGESETPGSPS